jgi:penicillin-binding protein 1A
LGSTPRHEGRPEGRESNGRPERPATPDPSQAGAGEDPSREPAGSPQGRPAGDGASPHTGRRSVAGVADRSPPTIGGSPPLRAQSGGGNGTVTSVQRRKKPRLRKVRAAVALIGLAMLAFVSWIFGIMMAVSQDLPALENRAQYARAQNPVVYDINGEQIAILTNNEGRILLPSPEIAGTLKEAVVAIEDARFYGHRGVDYRGIARAVYQDILARSAQEGASTITQQFVKNALEAQASRTIFQKLHEAALAYHLERQWSKDKILTEYLNSIYFGEGAYGVEAAARTFFSSEHEGCGEGGAAPTCASQLRPHEAAMLAGMIASPSMYSPRTNPGVAEARRNLVLQRMMEQGYITPDEYEGYASEPLPAEDDIRTPSETSEAPYFTSWLRQQLVDKYGPGRAFGGGLEIHSTLDLELQREVEAIIERYLGGIEPTASVVVLDNETAGVRAMVGGTDFDEAPFNLATQGARQPGSAFKPFTLVAALEEGRSSSEVLTSTKLEIPFKARIPRKNGDGMRVVNELFPVSNYEDQYLGSASIATATTYSDNSVYTQLGMQVGPAKVARTAQKMGIESDLRTDHRYSVNGERFQPFNPALVLGGLTTGVSPLEMAHAYETIAQDGYRISGTMAASEAGVVAINKVTQRQGDSPNPGGKPVETNDGTTGENEVRSEQVVEPSIAAEVRSLLTSVVTSGTGTNASPSSGEAVWGKTGTTDDNGDAWFCGATEEITACVWVGHADGRVPMPTEFNGGPVDGGTYPALIFAAIVGAWEDLEEARNESDEPDDEPDGEPGPVIPAEPSPEPAPAPEPEVSSGDDGEVTEPATQGGGGQPEAGAGGGGGGSGGGIPDGGGPSPP